MSYSKGNRSSNRLNKSIIPCKYFSSGMTCMYGDQCQFYHDKSLLKSQSSKASPTGKETQNAYHNPLTSRRNENSATQSGYHGFPTTNFTSNSTGISPTEEGSPPLVDLMSSFSLSNVQSRNNYNPNAEEFIPGITNNKPPRQDNRSGYSQANTMASSNYNKLSPRHKNNSVPAGLNRSHSTPSHQSLTTNPSYDNFHRQLPPTENSKKPPGKSNRRPQFTNKVESRQFFSKQQMAPHSSQEGNKKPTKHYFMNHNFKQELLVQRLLRLAEVNPDEFGLPREVKHYNSLYPLEMNQQDGISSNFGYRTICFKAINSHNGQTYLLRRVIGFRASQSTSLEVINKWKKIKHSGIVQLHEVFTTKAFGDNSLIAIYDYYPANETMQSHYFDTTKQSYTIGEDGVLRADVNMARNNIEFLDENIIWKYVIQLTSALRLIHVAGLACQILNVTKVLVASRSRLRINGVGILDILGNDSLNRSAIASRQMTDLTSLGRLLLALACRSLAALDPENYSQSLDFVANSYSSDLRDLIFGLLTCQQHMPQVVHKIKSVNDVMPLIGARFYTHINDLYFENDILEVELENELENDRLVRLLLKLGIVNDRPEFFLDGDWSETGDRYLLKLFRDYIFHQVKQDGSPWIDMAHMIQCLNKLDVGSQDRICLSSRDEKSVLVVSYKDLRDCFERTINEVFVAAGIKNPARG